MEKPFASILFHGKLKRKHFLVCILMDLYWVKMEFCIRVFYNSHKIHFNFIRFFTFLCLVYTFHSPYKNRHFKHFMRNFFDYVNLNTRFASILMNFVR